MLKIILPFMFLLVYQYFPMMLIILSLIMLISLIKLTTPKMLIFDNISLMDKTSILLFTLTMISIILILISSNQIKEIKNTILLILIILIISFSTTSMFLFYIMFELVLIPTMILITKSGKQPERLQASIYLMMYTIVASLPLLMNIILLTQFQSFLTPYLMMTEINLILPFILAFLVKSPMFMTHLWLPKAHVEAPLEGSMILAAVLLKLGGYGLIRFLPLCISKINLMNTWIMSISVIGAISTSLNCARQKDLKSLIAYSSVAHMALMLMGLFCFNSIGLNGAIMMMIAHGLSSSALFFLVNNIYMKYSTRNTFYFKGLMKSFPNISFWWFIFMAINISAPPTINTISEIMIMMSSILWNKSIMLMIFLISMSVTTFSMMMFMNISHNKNEMSLAMETSHKDYMSLFIHMVPLIILILKLNMFI